MEKAIFWDFDGTIIYPNHSFFDAMSYALETSGYEIEAEKIKGILYSACSWYHPEKDYLKHTGNKWWKCLLQKFELFFRVFRLFYAILFSAKAGTWKKPSLTHNGSKEG